MFDRSEHQKRLWQNPEYRKHMSEIHKGKIGYWKDKKRSKETRDKISKMRQGKCMGSNHPNWKNGKYIHNGYVYILQREHPYCEHHGYVKRSRLIMEKILKRYLKPSEKVHHKNDIKTDDRPKNLKLLSTENRHQKLHSKQRKRNKLGQFI